MGLAGQSADAPNDNTSVWDWICGQNNHWKSFPNLRDLLGHGFTTFGDLHSITEVDFRRMIERSAGPTATAISRAIVSARPDTFAAGMRPLCSRSSWPADLSTDLGHKTAILLFFLGAIFSDIC